MTSLNVENATLPAFSEIKPELIEPTIKRLIEQNLRQVNELVGEDNPSWDSLIKPLSLIDDRLSKAWSPIRHLNSVKSTDELRDVYNRCLPMLSDYSTAISQNQALYQGYLKISKSDAYADFDPPRQKAITDALQHFRLGGVNLEGKARQRFQVLQKELSELQSQFENNVLDSTQSWQFLTEEKAELNGLPGYVIEMAEQLASQKNLSGYRLTLDMPCYLGVITYADNRQLREKIYRAYTTRASDQDDTGGRWDNAPIMEKIVAKRQEKAKLLGFDNYAEYSLETKMASSTSQVEAFLSGLSDRSRKAALSEVRDRQLFAETMGFSGSLQPWDYAYYGEKLKQNRFQIREEDLKPYFSDNQVIHGLFQIVERLYKINISPLLEGVDVWNETVGFYQIKNLNGEIIGQFYLDLYARENKRGGAWMDECVNRYKIDGVTQIPVAYLTCNLTPPVGNTPAQFTHDEVITLFHEFGHGLHHMLTTIDVPEVAGINGVEWDAVELPSQFMENFCWQKEALNLFARHCDTGETLPDALFDKMIAAKNFQSALQMLRQLEFSLFDIRLHRSTDIDSSMRIQATLDEVRNEVSVVPNLPENRFQNGFSHIFAGGYAAGYYSYKWAEVLSADAFSAFEEEGIFNFDTGKRFLHCVLEKGGSRSAIDSFCCFRGREPEIDALLRHSGIQEKC